MNALYRISDEWNIVIDMLYDEEMDEQTILDTLEALEGEFEVKADNYAKIYKSLKADAEAAKQEAQRLQARSASFENRAKWIKDTLEANMKTIGKTKFKTALFSFNIQKNGGLQPLVIDELDVKKLPAEYLIPQDPLPNNEKIRQLLEAQQVSWAHLGPRGESLRIR